MPPPCLLPLAPRRQPDLTSCLSPLFAQTSLAQQKEDELTNAPKRDWLGIEEFRKYVQAVPRVFFPVYRYGRM